MQFGSFPLQAKKQPDPELVALGKAIEQLREQHAIAASELAAAAGIARERLAALEAGEVDPPYDLLLALADGLDVRLEELVRLARELGRRPGEAGAEPDDQG
jgi:transcriptional regulator with XRE-family HTH domain